MLLSGILDHDLVDLELPPSKQIVDWMRQDRLRLDAIVQSRTAVCPRLVLGFHPPHGFSVLLLETEASEGLFACRDLDFGPPEVLVQFNLVDAELTDLRRGNIEEDDGDAVPWDEVRERLKARLRNKR